MDDSTNAAAGPRKGCVDVFNEFMLDGATLAGYYKIPKIEGTDAIPERLVPFSEAVSGRAAPSPGTWVCFYEDDYKFEPFWHEPKKYLDLLGRFDGVIAPEASMPTSPRHSSSGTRTGTTPRARGCSVSGSTCSPTCGPRDGTPPPTPYLPRRATAPSPSGHTAA